MEQSVRVLELESVSGKMCRSVVGLTNGLRVSAVSLNK